MVGFNACQEDELVTINPLAETGELTFKLNQQIRRLYLCVGRRQQREKHGHINL